MFTGFDVVVKVIVCQTILDKDWLVPFGWLRGKESFILKWGALLSAGNQPGTSLCPGSRGALWIQPGCGREDKLLVSTAGAHLCGRLQLCWGFFLSVSTLHPLNKILFSPCQITAPYLHIGAITIMVLLSWPMALYAIRADKKGTVALLPAPCMTKDMCQCGKSGVQEPFPPISTLRLEVNFNFWLFQRN